MFEGSLGTAWRLKPEGGNRKLSSNHNTLGWVAHQL